VTQHADVLMISTELVDANEDKANLGEAVQGKTGRHGCLAAGTGEQLDRAFAALRQTAKSSFDEALYRQQRSVSGISQGSIFLEQGFRGKSHQSDPIFR
jgi:hypothetical protein